MIVGVQVAEPLVSRLRDVAARTGQAFEVVASVGDALARLKRGDTAPAVLVFGAAVADPVRGAQEVQALDRDLGVLLLAEPDRLAALARAIQFSPFLGAEVRCCAVDDAAIGEVLTELAARTRQRRHHQATLSAIQSVPAPSLSALPQAALYLDRLLTHAPIGVIAVAPDGSVQNWNPAASTILEWHERAAPGTPVAALFSGAEREQLDDLIRRSQRGHEPSPYVLTRFGSDHREQLVEVTAASLPAPGEAPGVLLLLADVTLRVAAERQARLGADIGQALTSAQPLPLKLQQCSEALVRHLNVAFARIWTLNQADQVLELQASAGLYTHLDGQHSRIPVGQWKIGLIAEERRPHLINNVIGDPRVSDQEWARREGMVAFAGYPLITRDCLVGVMGLFARHALTTTTLDACASVANSIALAIEQARADEQLVSLIERERAARAQAEAALRARDEFFASVTHDLKNPLGGIKGYVQLLRRRLTRLDLPTPSWLNEGLGEIETAANRTVAQIDAVLDVARGELSQEPALRRQPTDLVALARRVVADYQRTTERHQLVLETALPELVGEYDAYRLERLLANLVGNAIKYSPDGGEVTVGVAYLQTPTGPYAEVTVRDEGIGIPAADLPHVFERFHRAGNVVGHIGGTGIGLTSAWQIVEQHDGTITVTSTEGMGTTFTVQLPLTSAPSAHQPALDDLHDE